MHDCWFRPALLAITTILRESSDHASAISGAPRPPTLWREDLVERVCRGLDDAPRVNTDDRVRARSASERVIDRRRRKTRARSPCSAPRPEDPETAPPSCGHDRTLPTPAGGLVIGGRGYVLLTLANRDLIEPGLRQVREQIAAALASVLTRRQIRPTVRHAVRIS